MARRFGISIHIEGAMRNLEHDVKARPTGPSEWSDEHGQAISNSAAYANLAIERMKGRRVLPMSSKCGNPCPSKCPGFSYETGCPGVEIPKEPQ